MNLIFVFYFIAGERSAAWLGVVSVNGKPTQHWETDHEEISNGRYVKSPLMVKESSIALLATRI